MVFVTQLVYLHQGKETLFEEFEAVAMPLIGKYGGELLLRLRPTTQCIVGGSIETPYEVHLVRFPSDEAFARFDADDERRKLLHLKEGSVRASMVIRGTSP